MVEAELWCGDAFLYERKGSLSMMMDGSKDREILEENLYESRLESGTDVHLTPRQQHYSYSQSYDGVV